MKRRTFLKTFIGIVVSPGLAQFKSVPEAIYTAKTVVFDIRYAARMALGAWLEKIHDEDIIFALSELGEVL